MSLGAHLRGHILSFGRSPATPYEASRGIRLLLIFLVLEIVIGPRLWLLSMAGVSAPPVWLRVPLLLVVALLLVRFFAGVRFSEIGLRPWSEWNTTERSYLLQVIVIGNVVFFLLYAKRIRAAFADPSSLVVVAVSYLLWGFYQELMYRGILQTELTRRWGAVAGVLISNILYTCGPLHLYHFSGKSPVVMFAAIFAIGLFFGVLFRRSGNLWIVGILHGIGDVYITGLQELH